MDRELRHYLHDTRYRLREIQKEQQLRWDESPLPPHAVVVEILAAHPQGISVWALRRMICSAMGPFAVSRPELDECVRLYCKLDRPGRGARATLRTEKEAKVAADEALLMRSTATEVRRRNVVTEQHVCADCGGPCDP